MRNNFRDGDSRLMMTEGFSFGCGVARFWGSGVVWGRVNSRCFQHFGGLKVHIHSRHTMIASWLLF